MHKISDAEEKFCPFAIENIKVSVPNSTSSIYVMKGSLCTTTNCMAWVKNFRDNNEGYCVRLETH